MSRTKKEPISSVRVSSLLFHAESGHWVETRGAPHRQGACQNSCHEQYRTDEDVNCWIAKR
jgi:hypothetical protein